MRRADLCPSPAMPSESCPSRPSKGLLAKYVDGTPEESHNRAEIPVISCSVHRVLNAPCTVSEIRSTFDVVTPDRMIRHHRLPDGGAITETVELFDRQNGFRVVYDGVPAGAFAAMLIVIGAAGMSALP